ncbi:hypothetical protein M422DRAFT_186752 [Sphaerobolus stellatus SS14]|uniref:Calpain catalytic domain-containing protein n=1 Tax=Sphaerobolus stellatus (strain SS14) TaxID=990650 RepID=A0A0C9UZW5_SPHS4|nr:hypothetical protein M422DRAFT_186752 [Sphaerobolus stellatus SS14]
MEPQALHEARVYQQEPFRAGLLVTDELEKAITRCRERVQELAEECRSRNRKFRDLEFDLDNGKDQCLHSLSTPEMEKFKPADCLRVSQIFDNPQFIIDGALSSDIVQGRLGNCWFLCAVATVSSMPGLIDKICVEKDEKVGIYGFIFCRDGEWVDVIIDDQLYTTVPKWEALPPATQNLYHKDKDLYDRVARKGSKTLYFASSSQENETWVPLLEKAFAKLHGDYASLNGGFAFQGLEDLTGYDYQFYSPKHIDILDKDDFWKSELMRTTEDRLFGCYLDSLAGSAGFPTELATTEGLINSHAYSILQALEYNGKRFLKIRNPWGRGEWNGRWSDGSKEWTKEWLPALEVLNHQFGDDGSFIMEYEDFLKTWYAVERTQLFDESWIQSSHWLNVTSRSFPCPWQYGDVSYTFTLPEDSPAVIVLSQADSRYWNELSGYSLWTFDFILYKQGSKKVVGRSEYSIQWPRSVTLTKDLDAGDYVLHVRLDRNYHRQRDYVQSNLPEWDNRKLARVSSEAAKSSSMAANYNHREWRDQMVVPPEFFAGKNLMQLEVESFEANTAARKALKASFFPAASKTTESSGVLVLAESAGQDGTTVSVIVEKNEAEAPEDAKNDGDNEGNKAEVRESENPVSPTDELGPEQILRGPFGDDSLRVPPYQPENPVVEDSETGFFIDSSRLDVHLGITCDGCQKPVIIGTRWKCLVCDGYDLCDDCHASGLSSHRHLVDHNVLRIETRDAPLLPHEGFSCDGCHVSPIIGTRWRCLVCDRYDLCDACRFSGAHPSEHQMLKIETPGDAEDYDVSPSDDDTVLLGLRVYTKKRGKVNISGQLRHGKLISWRNPSLGV